MTEEDYEFWNKANVALVEASMAEAKRNEEQISAMIARTEFIDDPIADFRNRQVEKRGNDKITRDLARWELHE